MKPEEPRKVVLQGDVGALVAGGPIERRAEEEPAQETPAQEGLVHQAPTEVLPIDGPVVQVPSAAQLSIVGRREAETVPVGSPAEPPVAQPPQEVPGPVIADAAPTRPIADASEVNTSSTSGEPNGPSGTIPKTDNVGPEAPEVLEPKVRALLLAEAQERYKSENERGGQAYTRIGIFIAILVMYVNILIRFVDKPPVLEGSWAYCAHCKLMFIVSGLLFMASIATGICCAVLTLRPHDHTFIQRASGWLASMKDFRTYLSQMHESAEMEEALVADLQTRQLDGLAKAIEKNYLENNNRLKWVHRTSYTIIAGFIALVFTLAAYSVLMFKAPPGSNVTAVKLVDPIPVTSTPTTVRVVSPVPIAPETTSVRVLSPIKVITEDVSVKVVDPVKTINYPLKRDAKNARSTESTHPNPP